MKENICLEGLEVATILPMEDSKGYTVYWPTQVRDLQALDAIRQFCKELENNFEGYERGKYFPSGPGGIRRGMYVAWSGNLLRIPLGAFLDEEKFQSWNNRHKITSLWHIRADTQYGGVFYFADGTPEKTREVMVFSHLDLSPQILRLYKATGDPEISGKITEDNFRQALEGHHIIISCI